MQAFPNHLPTGSRSNRAFYVVSALLHIVVALVLTNTWILETSTRKAQAQTDSPIPEKPTAARIAIDVGPIKFCDLKIESLVGGPRPQPTP